MRKLCGSISILLACTLGLQADVSYDVTLTRNFFTPPGIRVAVPNAAEGVYDIRPDLYDAPTGNKPSLVMHVMIKGNKLSVVKEKSWQIVDLDARTLTTIDKAAKAYSVESLDAAYARESHEANYGFGTDLNYEVVANKTGKAKQADGKTLEEYDVISIARPRGKPEVHQSIRCWLLREAPSPELQEFRRKWFATTGMAFPDNTIAAPADVSANGIALKKIAQMGSWAPSLVWENRPSQRIEASRPGYDSASPEIRPVNDYAQDPRLFAFGQIVEVKTELSPVSSAPIPDDAFTVPSGFKLSKKPLPRR